jgi:sigma-E factor negative regulatory protein RseA
MALVIFPGLYGDVAPLANPAAAPSALVRYADKPGTRWGVKTPEIESKLNDYLVNHQEYAPTAGMKGMLPYASFVSYDAGR